MWELDYKESWVLNNWCFWTVVLEKTLESPLGKEIQSVHPKGNQSWILIGRTDGEAEAPILWLLDAKNWLIGKDPDAGKDSRQEEKGMTEDEMVRWHHWLDGHKFEQAPGVGDGQGSLACCSPWGCKESDMTERLNWTELIHWKDWCWSWSSKIVATWCEEPTHWKRPWCWERLRARGKGMKEDERAEWHHWLNGREFEQTLGDSEGQGSLACCNPRGCKESDMT